MTSPARPAPQPEPLPGRPAADGSPPTNPTRPGPQVLRLRTPGDLLAFLPYQMGYHPRRSAVVVCWHGKRLGLVQRVDLPPHGQAREAADLLLAVLRREPPPAVTLIGYEEGAEESAELLTLLAEECGRAGIAVRDHLVVSGGRWRSRVCTDPGCCPAGGSPLPQPSEVPAVVEMVARGVHPAADRGTLQDRLIGSRPLLQRAVDTEAQRLLGRLPRPQDHDLLHRWRDRALRSWAVVLGGADPELAAPVGSLAPSELARAAVSLADVELRDALIAWITPGNLPLELIDPELLGQLRQHLGSAWSGHDSLSGGPGAAAPGRDDTSAAELDDSAAERGRAVENRLVDLCGALPAGWAVGPLTVLAAHAWWRGDGALARIALDLALAADPGYRLARLLLEMVDRAIRPTGAPAA